jgi:peptidylprolyl isomerase
MQSVRILADIPANERPQVKVASEQTMQKIIAKVRQEKGADFSVCDVVIPAKIN